MHRLRQRPIAVLMVMMSGYRKSPEISVIVATAAMLAIGMVRPYQGKRLRPSDILGSLAGTGRSFTDLIVTLAAAGFVIGVLNATGLSYAPTLLLIGAPLNVAWDTVTALIGVYYVTAGIVGFFQRDLGPARRIAMLVTGGVALVPDASVGLVIPGIFSGVGVVVGGALLVWEFVACRRPRVARGLAE